MLPAAEIRFNYLGQLDQLLRKSSLLEPAKESSGATQSPNGLRNYLINVIGSVTEGRLHMNWAYSANIHQHRTIERLADGFMEALRVMITHCQSSGAGGFTPSDFPKAGLNQKDLDKFIAKLS
jgi:non-ribosomal peptide synthase protein (TIGR01720 family)